MVSTGETAWVGISPVAVTWPTPSNIATLTSRGTRRPSLEIAVIEPQSRQLVLRAGGTSYVKGRSAAVDLEKDENWRVKRGFDEASAALMVNFETELRGFEARVREGTAPIKVVRHAKNSGGGGALDPLWLASLALVLTWAVSRRYWDSRVARKVIFGQRSIVNSRFTRDGAR